MEENQFRGKVETFVSDGQMCQPAASLLHILHRVDDDDVDGGADDNDGDGDDDNNDDDDDEGANV